MNEYEMDAIVHCVLDFSFMVLIFAFGYKMLHKKFDVIQWPIKRVLLGFYMVTVLQAIASAVMVDLLFRYHDDLY